MIQENLIVEPSFHFGLSQDIKGGGGRISLAHTCMSDPESPWPLAGFSVRASVTLRACAALVLPHIFFLDIMSSVLLGRVATA